MSDQTELVAQASSFGLVTRREVLDGSVAVRDLTPHHRVFAITVRDHPVAYVKRAAGAPSPTGEDPLDRERRALLTLVDRECAPRVVADSPADSLWVSAITGLDLSLQRGTLPALADLCQTWGAAVARLHTTPTRGSAQLTAPRPWVLDPRHVTRPMRSARPGTPEAAVLGAFDSVPGLRAAADEVDHRWTESHWIHGDLSPSHVLVDQRPALRVRFVDLESAGLGDPAWDLASASDTIVSVAADWHAPAAVLEDYFLQGYRRAGGPGRLYPAIQAVRAVATAWRIAGTDPGGVQRWLERAREYAGRAVGDFRAVA